MLKTSDQPQIMIGPAASRPAPIHLPLTITQPAKEDKAPKKIEPINFSEIAIVVGCFVAILGVLAFLFLNKDQAVTQDAVTSVLQPAVSSKIAPAPVSPVAALTTIDSRPESIEADLYFDANKGKLRDESKELLQRYAELLKKEDRWGLIVQGYTDQQGRPDYNKALGMKRAEAAKKYLVELGVPASSIRVVSLGKEGTLCDDQGEECRKLNRRVHLELRKDGLPVIMPATGSMPVVVVDEPISSVPAAEGKTAAEAVESSSASH